MGQSFFGEGEGEGEREGGEPSRGILVSPGVGLPLNCLFVLARRRSAVEFPSSWPSAPGVGADTVGSSLLAGDPCPIILGPVMSWTTRLIFSILMSIAVHLNVLEIGAPLGVA